MEPRFPYDDPEYSALWGRTWSIIPDTNIPGGYEPPTCELRSRNGYCGVERDGKLYCGGRVIRGSGLGSDTDIGPASYRSILSPSDRCELSRGLAGWRCLYYQLLGLVAHLAVPRCTVSMG